MCVVHTVEFAYHPLIVNQVAEYFMSQGGGCAGREGRHEFALQAWLIAVK